MTGSPFPPVPHDGLDLTDPDDRAIYRGRVAEALTASCGTPSKPAPPSRPPRRADASRALADAWIKEFTS